MAIKLSTWLLYAGLVAACTSPVWGVAYFVNQDGPAHVHSAYLIAEILRGNPSISDIYVLNEICIPNVSVHLILALLLQVFSAFTATKIVVCFLFAGVVAAIGWLRLVTVGVDGLKTSLLIGAVVGFNWLWLVGNYNFMLSVIVLAFTLGAYWKWRGRLGLLNSSALVILLAAAYFSHIIGFAILAGSIVVLALNLPRELRYRALAWTLGCLLPFAPLAIWYRSISDDGSPAMPVWRSLVDPYSLSSWLTQIRSADAFLLISHSALPFVTERELWFVLFTPLLWIIVAFAILSFVTMRRIPAPRYFSSSYFPFAFLLLASVVLATFAPDDFGLTRGGIIRERIVICAPIFIIPIFRTAGSRALKRMAQAILVFVIAFQTAAVWDYSIRGDRSAKEFVAAGPAMSDLRSIATVTVYTEHPRFHATPEVQLNLFNSIGTNLVACDNYEFGHFLFPVRTKNNADKDFTLRLNISSVFYADEPDSIFTEKLVGLDSALANDGGRIDALLVWGGRADVDAVVTRHFEHEPFYQSENLRLFRRRK